MRQVRRPLLFDLQAIVLWAADEVPAAVSQRVSDGHMVYVSVVSPWEFLLKSNKRSFGMDYDQLLSTIEALQAEFLPIKLSYLAALRALPFVGKHRDPFDRLLIAQALSEDLILVGGDRQFPLYQKTHPLQLLWDY